MRTDDEVHKAIDERIEALEDAALRGHVDLVFFIRDQISILRWTLGEDVGFLRKEEAKRKSA